MGKSTLHQTKHENSDATSRAAEQAYLDWLDELLDEQMVAEGCPNALSVTDSGWSATAGSTRRAIRQGPVCDDDMGDWSRLGHCSGDSRVWDEDT